MDVGLAMTARNHPAGMRPLTEVYREVLDEAVLGEQLGSAAGGWPSTTSPRTSTTRRSSRCWPRQPPGRP